MTDISSQIKILSDDLNRLQAALTAYEGMLIKKESVQQAKEMIEYYRNQASSVRSAMLTLVTNSYSFSTPYDMEEKVRMEPATPYTPTEKVKPAEKITHKEQKSSSVDYDEEDMEGIVDIEDIDKGILEEEGTI